MNFLPKAVNHKQLTENEHLPEPVEPGLASAHIQLDTYVDTCGERRGIREKRKSRPDMEWIMKVL
jgi:hypothetical protein